MRRAARPARPASLAAVTALASLALFCTACERGCLTTWLSERAPPRSGGPGGGGAPPRGSTPSAAAGAFDLAGTDCSDGLARCTDGRLEVSLAAHLPDPCVPRETPGGCSCPWRPAGTCSAGCVKDGLEVVASAEVAAVQLCVAPEPVVRPVLPTALATVSVCADEGVRCEEGIVSVCTTRGQPTRALATCVHGCAPGITVDHGPLVSGDGTASILCRRAHAERR